MTSVFRILATLLLAFLMIPDLSSAANSNSTAPIPPPRPYCLAVRGNGELAPAHWGALAKVVERLGLPGAMSGGSSATISMFLLESIAMNPTVKNATLTQERERASLLLKTLQSYLEVIAAQPAWRELGAVANFLKQQAGGESMEFMAWLEKMAQDDPAKLAELVLANLQKIQTSLQLPIETGLVDPETFRPLFTALNDLKTAQTSEQQRSALARIDFYSGEIYRSVALLGKFNAETDDNLFFRAGIVNFTQLAASFGQIANFYAGREMSAAMKNDLLEFYNLCGTISRGKNWNQIRQEQPACDRKFKTMIVNYRNSDLPSKTQDRNLDLIGAGIPTYPTTSVLAGSAYTHAKVQLQAYSQELSPKFGAKFTVKPEEVWFGYWGAHDELARISRNLKHPIKDSAGRVWDFSKDAKSLRFKSLGHANWSTVMSLSPAEPGLAPLQEFKVGNDHYYSAGGWSDLHPGAVLKASGCDQVVYVTRRGGESLFAQGVAKKLMSFDDLPWLNISTSPEHKAENVIRNNQGHVADQSSRWSQLFNLANPRSSYNQALRVFDAVVCSDWNRFDITQPNAVSDMINESYAAPWAFTSLDSRLGREARRRDWNLVSTRDNVLDSKLGYRPYAGCLPF